MKIYKTCAAKSAEKPPQTMTLSSSVASANSQKQADVNKPLYTVPPTFKPPPVIQPSNKPSATNVAVPKINMNTVEIDEVVKQMIAIQIESFETEMKQIQVQARKLMDNVGDINIYFVHI